MAPVSPWVRRLLDILADGGCHSEPDVRHNMRMAVPALVATRAGYRRHLQIGINPEDPRCVPDEAYGRTHLVSQALSIRLRFGSVVRCGMCGGLRQGSVTTCSRESTILSEMEIATNAAM